MSPGHRPALAARRFGRVNWIGLRTLYVKESLRFLKIGTQTVLAPLVTSALFLAVFVLALGREVATGTGVDFATFLYPGLVAMTMAQNAFANSSSSLVVGKVQGSIVDLLMPPLAPGETVAGLALGGMTRGLAVALATALALGLVVQPPLAAPAFAVAFAVLGSLMLALLGILAGIWAERFEHMAAVTNFVVTPATFLSGTFYAIDRLPEGWQALAHANPVFHMIDGFRYGFLGHAGAAPFTGLVVLAVVDGALWLACQRLIASGWKLRP